MHHPDPDSPDRSSASTADLAKFRRGPVRLWPIALIIAIGTGIITALVVAAAIFTIAWMLQ